jgi:hypothetical protein
MMAEHRRAQDLVPFLPEENPTGGGWAGTTAGVLQTVTQPRVWGYGEEKSTDATFAADGSWTMVGVCVWVSTRV